MPSKTKKQKLLKVVVDRRKWLRGKGEGASWLLQPKGAKMCCLGFVGEACGVSIRGKRTPGDTKKGRENWPVGMFEAGHPNLHSDACSDLMLANDDDLTSEVHRESQIKSLGKKAGIEFSFVN